MYKFCCTRLPLPHLNCDTTIQGLLCRTRAPPRSNISGRGRREILSLFMARISLGRLLPPSISTHIIVHSMASNLLTHRYTHRAHNSTRSMQRYAKCNRQPNPPAGVERLDYSRFPLPLALEPLLELLLELEELEDELLLDLEADLDCDRAGIVLSVRRP